MRNSGACIAALLLLAVGVCAARQLQQENPVHVIDPWVNDMRYPPVTVGPNTAINFKWMGSHGVYRVPSGQCPSNFTPSPSNGIVALAPVTDGGDFTTRPLPPGVYWYACPVPGHCPSGMIIQVTVGPATAG